MKKHPLFYCNKGDATVVSHLLCLIQYEEVFVILMKSFTDGHKRKKIFLDRGNHLLIIDVYLRRDAISFSLPTNDIHEHNSRELYCLQVKKNQHSTFLITYYDLNQLMIY